MRVKVGDIHCFFDVEGAKLVPDGPTMREKPTLLLLHGGPGHDHTAFKPYFSQFADIAQVVYLEHRGNGRSDRSTSAHWNLDQWADDVHEFCRALEIEHPIVLGVSFGGAVAMHYVARYPEEPTKVILISTAGHKRMDRSLAVYERLGGAQAREAAHRSNENPGPETGREFLRYCYPLYCRTALPSDLGARALVNYDLVLWWERGQERYRDLLAGLAHVKCPVLVLGGEDDPQTPIEDQEDIVQALPSALVHFERFAACGHGVWPDEPERVCEVLRRFILSDEGA